MKKNEMKQKINRIAMMTKFLCRTEKSDLSFTLGGLRGANVASESETAHRPGFL